MTTYAQHYGTRVTPQSQPIPGKIMVPNSAGGFAFAVDDWTRLHRFLVLGSEGGSYYASERDLTIQNAECVRRCLESDALRTVKEIVAVSEAGRAPKNSPAIFSLAMGCAIGNAKSEAMAAIPLVCRTGTHLFEFVECVEKFRGWGRSLRHAVGAWYNGKSPRDLGYQVAKYQQRNGWSHHDVLHKCHAAPASAEHNAVFSYVKSGSGESLPVPIMAMEEAKRATDAKQIAQLVREHDLVRECIPTQFLNSLDVWSALLDKMPMHAMLRNLGKMACVGLTAPMSEATRLIAGRLTDEAAVRKSRMHPLAILLALTTYRAGRGFRGELSWNADSNIVDALDKAFYLSFGNVEATGKRWLLGLDVSGSMSSPVSNSHLSCRDATAALAMVTVQAEPFTHCVGFTGSGGYSRGNTACTPLPFGKRQSLADAVRTVSGLSFGSTDCSLPMQYAHQNKIDVDVFVVLTDNETWRGSIHPCQALQAYRDVTGIPAKLIVVGMASNGFTIADPNDAGMMDVVGFDTSVPQVMADFALT